MSEETASDWVILCEGSGDAAFFKHLIKERDLPGYYVTFPTEHGEVAPGGVDGFTTKLRALVLENERHQWKGLLIVGDKDSDARAAFGRIRSKIEGAEKGYGVPNEPLSVVASGEGLPAVAVMTIPLDDPAGQLETLCLKAFGSTHPKIARCAEEFAGCSGADKWAAQNKREKMMLRSMIAACCENDPNTSLTHAWSEGRPKMIDLRHSCFDAIAEFLRDFPAKVTELIGEA
jgi:hypothetical protein